MSLVLQPGNSFTVVRQIANHLDTDTNYVQAVIRNAYTDAIIDTLALTGRGSQRFSLNWKVPADSSGQGFYVSIVTSVYTDSGYTTKNPNYGDDENTYLVQDRVLLRGGGGLDAFTVRQIVSEELSKLEIPDSQEIPEPKDRTGEVLSAISGIQLPEATTVDFGPLSKKLDVVLKAVIKAIKEKEVTPATDLAPVLDAIDEKEVTPPTDIQPILDQIATALKPLDEKTTLLVGKGKQEAAATNEFIRRLLGAMAATPARDPVPFDVTKLAS